MGVLAVGAGDSVGTGRPCALKLEVGNGSGVTVNFRKPGDIVLDPNFDVESDGDLENGRFLYAFRVLLIANVSLTGGSIHNRHDTVTALAQIPHIPVHTYHT